MSNEQPSESGPSLESGPVQRRPRRWLGLVIAGAVVVALIGGGVVVGIGSMQADTNGPAADKPTPVRLIPNPTSNSSVAGVPHASDEPCVPVGIVVKEIGVDQAVVPMGTNSQGQIYPPAHTTMWYDKSPQPGQAGISIIAGHVTYDGPDNFYQLARLAAGQPITISCASGRVLDLKVTSSASISKVAATTDQRLWGTSSVPVVALVTCDLKSPVVNGHHLNNYVVWASPSQ